MPTGLLYWANNRCSGGIPPDLAIIYTKLRGYLFILKDIPKYYRDRGQEPLRVYLLSLVPYLTPKGSPLGRFFVRRFAKFPVFDTCTWS